MRKMRRYRDFLIEELADRDKALSFLEVLLEEYEKDPDGAALYYGFSAAVEAQGGVQKFAQKTHSTPQAVSDALLSKDEIQIAELLKKQVLARRGKDKNIAQNEALPKWKKVFISEVAKVVTGKTPPTAVKSNYDGKVPFVSPADLGSTKYIQCAQKTLSIKGSKLSPVIPAGSTLFTCIGSTIGKTGIASIELRTNQQINSAIPNNIDEEYLYYALSFISPKIKKLAAVQAIPIINKTGFENQIIRIPECRNIQKAIASLLEKWDTAIEKTEALIEAKEKRFKWLLKTLISDQQDNPEWQQVKLGEISTCYSGGTPSTQVPEYYDGEISFINSGDLNQRHIKSVKGMLSILGVENSSAKFVKKNTLLMALYGATAGVVAITHIDAVINQAVLAIVVKENYDNNFIFFGLEQIKNTLVKKYRQGDNLI